MSSAAPDAANPDAANPGLASGLGAEVTRRWAQIDPLLPLPGPRLPHCGAPLVVAGRGGTTAAGCCEHWVGAPGSLDLSWGAARRFQLAATVAGPDVAPALDQLLVLWRDHLAELPETGEGDTAAVVNWPSRDVDGIATLLRHGLDPLEVLAARTASRRASAESAVPAANSLGGLRIRRAGRPTSNWSPGWASRSSGSTRASAP